MEFENVQVRIENFTAVSLTEELRHQIEFTARRALADILKGELSMVATIEANAEDGWVVFRIGERYKVL